MSLRLVLVLQSGKSVIAVFCTVLNYYHCIGDFIPLCLIKVRLLYEVMDAEFCDLKAEYSNLETSVGRKEELILLMRKNLMQRNKNGEESIVCLDGETYSFNSDNVEDLYAIDAKFNGDVTTAQMSETSKCTLSELQGRNHYGPNNPYTGKL